MSPLEKPINLLSRFIHSGTILTVGSIVDSLIRFIRNIILTRILAPEAFGYFATVIAVVAALEAFAEVGLRQSVIQNKNGSDDKFINITWILSSLRGLLLYVVAYIITPYIANFVNRPDSIDYMRVGFFAILLNGMVSPKIHVLEKEFRFKNWVLLIQGAGILSVICTVILALILKSTWALIYGYVMEAFLKTTLSFIFYPIRPNLKYDPTYLQEIIQYSKRMFGLPISMMLFVQVDVFVIGRLLSMSQLGIYTMAKNLAEIPSTFISKAVNPIMMSSFSQQQENKETIRKSFLSITEIIATFGIPLIVFLIIYSKIILSIVYGQEYGDAHMPFKILCIYNYILICSSVIMLIYMSIGRPDIHRNASVTRTAVFLIMIYPVTYYFGLLGAAVTILLSMCILLFVQIIYLKKYIGINHKLYFSCWVRGVKLSLIVLLPGTLIMLISENMLISIIFGLLTCMISWLIALTGYEEMREYLKIKGEKWGCL